MALNTAEIKRGAVLAERYRILRPLGSGGMATVFLAEDRRLGREVAVKRLHTDAPEEGLRRFDREARVGAALNHPNLVSIFDTIAGEDGVLIVMEYVPGRSLAELKRGDRMEPEEAIPILRSVAEALDHAHDEGVVHRDVKPGNVLVREDGVVKLADLGMARAVDATQITREGSVIGTLPYMAPERRRRPGAGGPASDVYALAALAYELLSGDTPNGDSALRDDWPQAPDAATRVLEHGLDPDPAKRQPTAGRLIDDLESALAPAATTNGAATAPFEPFPEGPLMRSNGRGDTAVRTAREVAHGGGPRSRLAAVVGLGLLAAAVLAAVALGLGGGDEGGGTERAAEAQLLRPEEAARQVPTPAKEQPPAPAPAPAPEPAPEPAAAGGASAAALNDQGFALIRQGRYEEAVPILERAVAGSEGSGGLTYAYALFNLGNALRLAGRPEEAIPILERRLEIPNQQQEVARELELAREQASD